MVLLFTFEYNFKLQRVSVDPRRQRYLFHQSVRIDSAFTTLYKSKPPELSFPLASLLPTSELEKCSKPIARRASTRLP